MKDDCPYNTVGTLWRRKPTIKSLADGSKSRRELAEEFELAESTIYKRLRELTHAGLCKKSGNNYQLTELGTVLRDLYGDVENAILMRDLFRSAPEHLSIDPDVFRHSKITTPDRHAPMANLHEKFRQMKGDVSRVRIVTSVIHEAYFNNQEQLHDENVRWEFVLSHDSLNYIIGRLNNSEDIRLYECTEDIPFGLILFDGEVNKTLVLTYDQSGRMSCIIQNDSNDAIEWGKEVYRYYLQRSNETC